MNVGTDYEQIGRDLSEGAEYDRAKNQFVYQTDLLKRLENAERRMGAICSERRGPRMSIPAKPYDDDLFICAALRDARQQLSAAQTTAPSPLSARLAEALRTMIYETTHLSPENDDGSHDCRISRPALARSREALAEYDATP